jgi:hypothetical protein
MNPPTLTFTREIKISTNVIIRFVPRHGTEEIVHLRAHIFLLSDLFLLCDRMSPEELAQHATERCDMWLSYPPLAGKVLRVVEEGQGLSISTVRPGSLQTICRVHSQSCDHAQRISYGRISIC